jgi:hypothetical protein
MQPYVDLAQALISTAAIVVGGIWTYILFIKNRTKFPKLKLSHSLYSRQIDPRQRLIRVTLLMENQSSILVKLNEVTVRLLQLDPWPQGILDRKALLACISRAPWKGASYPAGANPARQLSLQPEALGAVRGGNDLD